MILGIQPFMNGADSIDVVGITLVAVAITVVVAATAVVARRIRRPELVLVAIAGLVVVGSARTSEVIDDRWRGRGDLSSVADLADGVLAGDAAVTFLLPDGTSTDRLMLYQLYLPHNEFTVVEDLDDARTGDLIFAASDDPVLKETATLEWTDPRRPWSLWSR
jgi:hypothetical protein